MLEWQLSSDEIVHFNRLKEDCMGDGKPMVLWGWKRDRIEGGVRQPESRTIYFSADLNESEGRVGIERSCFFLETRAKDREIQILKSRACEASVWNDPGYLGYARLRMVVG